MEGSQPFWIGAGAASLSIAICAGARSSAYESRTPAFAFLPTQSPFTTQRVVVG